MTESTTVTPQTGADQQLEFSHSLLGKIKAVAVVPIDGGIEFKLTDPQIKIIDGILQDSQTLAGEVVGLKNQLAIYESLIRQVNTAIGTDIKTILQSTLADSDYIKVSLNSLLVINQTINTNLIQSIAPLVDATRGQVANINPKLDSVKASVDTIKTQIDIVNTALTSIFAAINLLETKTQLDTLIGLAQKPKIPSIVNRTLTNASQEYSITIPNNTQILQFQCRKDSQGNYYDISYGFTLGGPYMALEAGNQFYQNGLSLSGSTLYLISVTAGTIVDYLSWSS